MTPLEVVIVVLLVGGVFFTFVSAVGVVALDDPSVVTFAGCRDREGWAAVEDEPDTALAVASPRERGDCRIVDEGGDER